MPRLLVIDDETEIVNMLEEYFSHRNTEVLSAQRAQDGLRLALKDRPDLVLLDLGLPDFSGEEVLRQIKAYLPGIKVVIVTGENDEELRKRVITYGCDAYFNKADLSLPELEATVRNLLVKDNSF